MGPAGPIALGLAIEMHNLAAANPEKVEELAQMWQTWAGKVGVVEWLTWDGGEARSSRGEKS